MKDDMEIANTEVNQSWKYMLREIMHEGREVAPRGKLTREILGHHCIIDMKQPVITIPERKMGYKFMCASAAWILAGDNRVETIAPFSKTVSKFSDDGITFFGAYGPKIRAQLDYVVNNLRADLDSRQAVINIWRENPPFARDIPCTLSHQFLVREGQLDVVTTMRSNDAWLGFPYDVFDVVMLAGYVLLRLGIDHIALGKLYHTAGSRHLYKDNWDHAYACMDSDRLPTFLYGEFNPYEFEDVESLVKHLWALAFQHKEEVRGTFLVNALIK